MIEGGNWKCFDHPLEDGKPFETASRKEWDEHCIKEGHTVSGTAPCLYCKKPAQVVDAPYQPLGQAITAFCDDCTEKRLKPHIEKVEARVTEKPEAIAPTPAETGGT